MKKTLISFLIASAAILGFASLACAQTPPQTVKQGGTGVNSVPAGYVLVGSYNDPLHLTPMATSSLGISGGSSGGGSGSSTTTADYILYNNSSGTVVLKTSTNAILSSGTSADAALNAITADAAATGANIYISSGTYYLNATSTFPGTTDAAGITWKIWGAGASATRLVVNNNADAFFYRGSVKTDLRGLTIYLKGASNGISANSNGSGFRSLWNSNFSDLMFQSTTTDSTGVDFNTSNDFRNTYSNIQSLSVGGCVRATTESANLFNPGNSNFSNIMCDMSGNTTTGPRYAYYFSGAAGTSLVNLDTFSNVDSFSNLGNTTAWYFNHTKFMVGSDLNSEGFSTTTDFVNDSDYNDMQFGFTKASTTPSVYYSNDSTSFSNTISCTNASSYAAAHTVFRDQNTLVQKPNVFQGAKGANCALTGTGTYAYATTSASIVRDVVNQGVSNQANVKQTGDKVVFNFTSGNNTYIEATSSGIGIFSNGNESIHIDSAGKDIFGPFFSVVPGSGLIRSGYSPIDTYQEAFGDFIMQTENPGYYFPRTLMTLEAPQDTGGTSGPNLGDQEAGTAYKLPVNGGGYDGNEYTNTQGIEIGTQKYQKSVGSGIFFANENYINIFKQGNGTSSPLRFSFENKDLNNIENAVTAAYFDPSGATAFGNYASTTSGSPLAYDKTIAGQFSSSTARYILAGDTAPGTHVFTVSTRGTASSTNLAITALATPAGSVLAVDPLGNVIATSSITVLPVPVTQGGTGNTTFPANQVLVGNVMSPISHSINTPADGNVLRFYTIDNVPSWGSLDLADSDAVGSSILGVGNGGTGTSTLTNSQLIYGTGTTHVGSVATTSATCSGTVSCTSFTVIGTSPITLTGSGGGGSGTGNVGTSSVPTIGQLAYWTTSGQTPEKLGSVATSSETCSAPISCTAHAVLSGGGPITLSTVPIASGGTNQTSFSSGGVVYFDGTRQTSLNTAFNFNGTNVGIATSTPWRQLSVQGNSDLGTNALAGFFTATTTTATSTFLGNFVQGTTTGSLYPAFSTVLGGNGNTFINNTLYFSGPNGQICFGNNNSQVQNGTCTASIWWNPGHANGGEVQITSPGNISINPNYGAQPGQGNIQMGSSGYDSQMTMQWGCCYYNGNRTALSNAHPYGHSTPILFKSSYFDGTQIQINTSTYPAIYSVVTSTTSPQTQDLVFEVSGDNMDSGINSNILETMRLTSANRVRASVIDTASSTATSLFGGGLNVFASTTHQDTVKVIPSSQAVGANTQYQVSNATMDTASNGWCSGTACSITFRNLVASAQLTSTNHNYIRERFNSSTNGRTTVITHAALQYASSTGNAFDYNGTPVQLTFNNGSVSATLPINGSLWSDWVLVPVIAGRGLVTGFVASTTFGNSGIGCRNTAQTGYTAYNLFNVPGDDVNNTVTAGGVYAIDGTCGVSASVDTVQSADLDAMLSLGSTTPNARFTEEQSTEQYSMVISHTGSSTPSFVILGTNGNGRTGIGTSTPGAQLDVNGGIIDESGAVDVGSAGSTAIMCYLNGGKLGHITISNLLISGSCVAN